MVKKIIISLGGSLVVPERNILATKFILDFKKLILKFSKKYKFIIIVGGGKICRFYQAEASKKNINKKELDWIGIAASQLNAIFVKSFFGVKAQEKIFKSPLEKIKNNKKVVFGGGWKPGWTTDYVSVKVSQVNKIKEILNLTDVDYIYTKDPDKFKDSEPIKEINWLDYIKIVGTKHRPGGSHPFDPKASLLAKKIGLKLISINGYNLRAVENYLTGKKFIGTIIEL